MILDKLALLDFLVSTILLLGRYQNHWREKTTICVTMYMKLIKFYSDVDCISSPKKGKAARQNVKKMATFVTSERYCYCNEQKSTKFM